MQKLDREDYKKSIPLIEKWLLDHDKKYKELQKKFDELQKKLEELQS